MSLKILMRESYVSGEDRYQRVKSFSGGVDSEGCGVEYSILTAAL